MGFRVLSLVAVLAVMLAGAASAQSDAEATVVAAASKRGFTHCNAAFDQWILSPEKDPAPPAVTKSRIKVCFNGKTQDVWRIAPTPAGPGINNEELVIVEYRKDVGNLLMWVTPHRAYVPHDIFFVGRTNKSGPMFEPLKGFEDWSPLGVTLPFIPGEVIYFGDATGVSRVGFTDLRPLPGFEDKMRPLRRDSVVMALSGAGFKTSQNYIRFFNNLKGKAYADWRVKQQYIEVQYYQSRANTDSVATMRPDARTTYLPIYPISDVRKAWDAATNTPGARSLALGVTGDLARRMLGPLATFTAALDAVGWDEEEYQRRSQACRDAGGIC